MYDVRRHPPDVPAAYPAHLEELVDLESGGRLWLWPIIPSDAEALAAEFAEATLSLQMRTTTNRR